MRLPLSLRLQTKIHIGIAGVALLCCMLIAVPVRLIVAHALSEQLRQKGLSIALNLAARSAEPMLAMDLLRMNDLVRSVATPGGETVYTFLQDRLGQVLAHTFKEGFPVALRQANTLAEGAPHSIRLFDAQGELIYDVAVPVTIEAQQIGTVHLGLSKTPIAGTIGKLLWTVVAVTAVSIIIASLAGAVFARQVLRRIRRLQEASQQVLRGSFAIRTAGDFRNTCWQLMHCEREECPAYGNDHRRCWHLQGTLCPACPGPEEEATAGHACRQCPCYRSLRGDELQELSESFDAMAVALQENIARFHQSRAVLESSERKYRRIFEGSMDTMFVLDAQGRFLDLNPAGQALFGLPAPVTPGTDLAVFIAEPDLCESLLEETRRIGFIKDRECLLRNRQEKEWLALLSLSGLAGEGERPATFEGVLKDITQRRSMEQQLLQADKLASLGQLAAGIAHEINNPLGLILGYTQLMLRASDGLSQSHEDLKTIERHVRNCKTIVEALLHFSRKTRTRMAAVEINEAVKAVVTVTRRQFGSQGIRLETRLDDTLPAVQGDSEKLEQVFMNLIMNARQSIDGSGLIEVETRRDESLSKIQVIVSDSGCGIPAHILGRIFDPFFTTKPTGQGTGLGLAVSYGIVTDHGGAIVVRSEAGKGSVFTVSLPLTPLDGAKQTGEKRA